ncbi:hypothetical protein BJ875DRAFT_187505 [Amylocarpus encephaloides]|uniref:RRM domain-containing protein n=1 Tax=Amylocarpus encephaloides TaxID=45428 RepID=A0A9P7YTV8_9HELO|nr:hypothetical protein BJ875DRAFT_187505 [Amylocarpus encephaloides]
MAPKGNEAVDFNAMINKDRQRRKNEALAEEIFGKGRRLSAPGAGMTSRKAAASTIPSLASRIGVAKRSSSTASRGAQNLKAVRRNAKPVGNVDAEWTHDLYNSNTGPAGTIPRGPRVVRGNRQQQLHTALHGSSSSPALNSQFNIIGTSKPGISIRGAAGPYIVVAKNLARGTTVADIESAMFPIGGIVLNCTLIAERPNVISEIEFETKEGADNVVDTLNNQNADGNILHVYHKIGAPASNPQRAAPATPQGPRADAGNERSDENRSAYNPTDRYASRDTARDSPRDRRRDGRDDVMDGSYGFDDRMDTDDRNGDRYNDGRGRGSLYSDGMVGSRVRGRGDSRERGRGNGNRGYNQ